MLFCRLLIFFKINFLKNSFRNIFRMSNSLDPDQARRFVGPDLGQNCLPKLSEDDTSRHRVNCTFWHWSYVSFEHITFKIKPLFSSIFLMCLKFDFFYVFCDEYTYRSRTWSFSLQKSKTTLHVFKLNQIENVILIE